ncbi:hypothetical protein ABIE66_003411 [Peribacillus sp. B2I2]
MSVTLKPKGIPRLYEEYKEYSPIVEKGMKIIPNKMIYMPGNFFIEQRGG